MIDINKPSVYGVGYLGVGSYKSRYDNKNSKIYSVWLDMIKRCYSQKYILKHPAYQGCSVDEQWHNFQNFGNWFDKNYVEGWQLDKDILIRGNKIYSPDTCCFIPSEINLLFTKNNINRGELPIGVSKKGKRFTAQFKKNGEVVHIGNYSTPEEAFIKYKEAKEKYIKEKAEKFWLIIPFKVYQTMINYKIEITD